MVAPYSLDLRTRVVAAASAGQTCRQIAKVFAIAPSTVSNWIRRLRDTGSPAALPMGGKRPFSLAQHREWVLARAAEKPDLTLAELKAELQDRGVNVSSFAIWNFLRRESVSFKKKAYAQANRIAPTWRGGARNGSNIRARLIRTGWFLSMRPGPGPT
jgi:transposase